MLESTEVMTEDADKHRVWILWVMALSTMLISSIAGAYWERKKLLLRLKAVGAVEAFFVCL